MSLPVIFHWQIVANETEPRPVRRWFLRGLVIRRLGGRGDVHAVGVELPLLWHSGGVFGCGWRSTEVRLAEGTPHDGDPWPCVQPVSICNVPVSPL